MKKFNLLMCLTVVAVLLVSTAQAQEQSVKGRSFLNAGIGLGTFGFTGSGGLPITASFEHGITDDISAGVYLGMVRTSYADYWKYRYTVIGVRGSYHFNEVLNVANPKLDVYGGASLYYRGYKVKWENSSEPSDDYKTSGGTVGLALHAAGRYMFANNIGVYAELGYGISPLQLGVTFKF